MARMVGIGAAAIDLSFKIQGDVALGTSNPCSRIENTGGVARNVIENLARLGLQTCLISLVGDDANGETIRRQLDDLGVDVSGLTSIVGASTASYGAVLDQTGELVLGLADMAILDHLTPLHLSRGKALLAEASWIFADANLPPACLDHLAAHIPAAAGLALDAVSMAKAGRLAPALRRADLLFLNLLEARSLLGRPSASAKEALDALILQGPAAVVLSLGPKGCLVAETGQISELGANRAAAVNVTGAGDALIAGTLAGLASGQSLPAAVRTGMRLAAWTVESQKSVRPDLSPAWLAP